MYISLSSMPGCAIFVKYFTPKIAVFVILKNLSLSSGKLGHLTQFS